MVQDPDADDGFMQGLGRMFGYFTTDPGQFRAPDCISFVGQAVGIDDSSLKHFFYAHYKFLLIFGQIKIDDIFIHPFDQVLQAIFYQTIEVRHGVRDARSDKGDKKRHPFVQLLAAGRLTGAFA